MLGANDASFNDGSGLADASITSAKLDEGANTIGHGFLEIGRTTLGSAGDTISVTDLPARKYLQILIHALDATDTIGININFNEDTGNNYAYQVSADFGAPSDSTSAATIVAKTQASEQGYVNIEAVNVATAPKLMKIWTIRESTSAASTAPDTRQLSAKWHNTSAQISRVDVTNPGAGNFDTGSEVVVFGKD